MNQAQPNEPHWMVLGSGRPNYRHKSEASARTEAERLARENPGCTFTVLKAVCSMRVNRLEVIEHELPTWLKFDPNETPKVDEMPF